MCLFTLTITCCNIVFVATRAPHIRMCLFTLTITCLLCYKVCICHRLYTSVCPLLSLLKCNVAAVTGVMKLIYHAQLMVSCGTKVQAGWVRCQLFAVGASVTDGRNGSASLTGCTFSSYGLTPRAFNSALPTLGPSWMSAVGFASTCIVICCHSLMSDRRLQLHMSPCQAVFLRWLQ